MLLGRVARDNYSDNVIRQIWNVRASDWFDPWQLARLRRGLLACFAQRGVKRWEVYDYECKTTKLEVSWPGHRIIVLLVKISIKGGAVATTRKNKNIKIMGGGRGVYGYTQGGCMDIHKISLHLLHHTVANLCENDVGMRFCILTFTIIYHPYLVWTLFGMRSLHLFTLLIFKSCFWPVYLCRLFGPCVYKG